MSFWEFFYSLLSTFFGFAVRSLFSVFNVLLVFLVTRGQQLITFLVFLTLALLTFFNLTVDAMLAGFVALAHSFFDLSQVDYDVFTDYLSVSGPSLTVLNSFFPLPEAIAMITSLVAILLYIWATRIIIKVIPFIG